MVTCIHCEKCSTWYEIAAREICVLRLAVPLEHEDKDASLLYNSRHSIKSSNYLHMKFFIVYACMKNVKYIMLINDL
ncbi:hypothetical protein CWR41_00270 [Cedecea lapagei]|nr:hypothetical protein CWR41_00270 [Cedecea lapagei]